MPTSATSGSSERTGDTPNWVTVQSATRTSTVSQRVAKTRLDNPTCHPQDCSRGTNEQERNSKAVCSAAYAPFLVLGTGLLGFGAMRHYRDASRQDLPTRVEWRGKGRKCLGLAWLPFLKRRQYLCPLLGRWFSKQCQRVTGLGQEVLLDGPIAVIHDSKKTRELARVRFVANAVIGPYERDLRVVREI